MLIRRYAHGNLQNSRIEEIEEIPRLQIKHYKPVSQNRKFTRYFFQI